MPTPQTELEIAAISVLQDLVARCRMDGVPDDSLPAFNAALALLRTVSGEDEPIPVGDAQDSDFADFEEASA